MERITFGWVSKVRGWEGEAHLLCPFILGFERGLPLSFVVNLVKLMSPEGNLDLSVLSLKYIKCARAMTTIRILIKDSIIFYGKVG